MVAAKESTKVRALREAKGLLQSFGFNGFSFQHVADALGIKKPSLYDHFKSKEDLGKALVEDYVQSFNLWMETVAPFGPREKIGALFERFHKLSEDKNRVCLVSAFSAEFNSLPKTMQKPIRGMMEIRRQWLVDVITEGQKTKIFRSDMSAEDLARTVAAICLGSQLVARVAVTSDEIRKVKETALKLLDA